MFRLGGKRLVAHGVKNILFLHVVLLHQHEQSLGGAGIGIGILPGAGKLDRKLFLQALLTALSFGVFFIIMGQTGEGSGLWPLVAARSVSVPIGIAVLLLTAVKPKTPRGSWLLVATSGAIDMAANIAILLAVQRGPIGVNAVLGSLYPVFTVAAAVIFLRERPTTMQTAGIGLAVLAIIALAV